ncbi:MAG TPA: NFACT RNA binding domain-containing protein [Candidatus Binatia bacterium]|nr:NFACT RNA binding domain-containing protein [Candidatus Binatia bacterium]
MLTDWLLIRRLAQEIEERLRGARVEDAGLTADGRVGLVLRRRGERVLLALDVFASPPLVTIEDEELGIAAEPGFVRALERSLRGMILTRASVRRNDRLIRLTFGSRSSFGVGDELELYLELVPRYGNLVLVKGGTVIAARKEFAPSENARRAVTAGGGYELPPLPARTVAIAAQTPPDEAAELDEPLYVYRRGGQLLQAYVAPLEGFDDVEPSRENSLLALLAELRTQLTARAGGERVAARRSAIAKRLDARERKLGAELAQIAAKQERADRREALRAEGEQIFSTLHELGDDEREAAKERAAALFAEYKRLGKSLPHLATRERAVRQSLEAVETLRWESERTAGEDLGAVEAAVAELGPRRGAPAVARVAKRKRPPLELRTPGGSRIVVGRSPAENAELTFRLARPNDVWFHAKGIPGAHVILARDDRAEVPEEDLAAAASLAAYYSRAKASSSVPVDYTLRKHVRKQRAAPPGLVWYTHAKTIVAEPKSLDWQGVAPRKDPV